jgi:hypothetical protein
MKNNLRNLSEQFKKWGEQKRGVPANDTVMKEKVLSALRPAGDGYYLRRPSRFWRWSFAMAAVAVLIFIAPGLYRALDDMTRFPVTPRVYSPMDENLGLTYGQDTGLAISDSRSVVSKITDLFADRSLNDTREFMQTDYWATIRTRQVEKLSHDAEMAVRGLGGRIDRSDIGTKYSNISFVIPKSSLAEFKEMINEMAPARFIMQNENNANLLDKKQTVEKQTEMANDTLAELQRERREILDRQKEVIGRLQEQINYLTKNIQEVSRIYTTNTVYRQSINLQISNYTKQLNTAKQSLASENKQFNQSLDVIDGNISRTNAELGGLDDQNEAILDTVATVQGTVTFRWISVIGIIDLYLPLRVAVPVVCVLIIILYFFFRREKGFEMP